LALLPLILTAVCFVLRQIGDHTLCASWNSKEEIGRLVVAFNDLLAQRDRERAGQQALIARIRAAHAQLQLVEAIPIALMVTAVPGPRCCTRSSKHNEYFSPSWTAFQSDRGRGFSVMVDGVSV
jgi:hypothetical protein